MGGFSLTNVKLFDKLLDKATSPLLLEIDWESIFQLCDIIKTHEVKSKYIIEAFTKKLHHENPHVILNTLQCMESVVKNCDGFIHKEIAQKDVMDVLKELAKKSPEQIRNKVLEIIQCWSYGLGSQYKLLTETYNQMKIENYHFPLLKESEAVFKTDDKECFRCRQIFTTFIHKHQCRACGNTFCDKCSSKYCSISKFNIDRDVRVCELCYEKLTTKVPLTTKSASSSSNKPVPSKRKKRVEVDEDLQLALAISRREAEEKERQKKKLNNLQSTDSEKSVEQEQTDNFVNDNEIDQFTSLAMEHINNFKLRMLSDQQRHRNISIDTAVQSAFLVLQHLHPELHRFMQLLDDKQTYYENSQDKLNQLKDAREALNALRADHYERKQQEAFELSRQRQIQLAQKLDFMRLKKQEYLEYHRQIHLQHLLYQELEMKNRLEQQRQFILLREQNSHLSMISYNSNHTDNNYINPAEQILLTNSTLPYIHQYQQQQQQHITPIVNENNSEPQLIIFN